MAGEADACYSGDRHADAVSLLGHLGEVFVGLAEAAQLAQVVGGAAGSQGARGVQRSGAQDGGLGRSPVAGRRSPSPARRA